MTQTEHQIALTKWFERHPNVAWFRVVDPDITIWSPFGSALKDHIQEHPRQARIACEALGIKVEGEA